ncbi:hypothetical protein JCM5353_001577 [Sporobolomyces roseus]
MAATDHPSASPLSIPIDVLLEILAEPVLESSDFARLCLVRRDIIPSARRKLYATVNCDYVLDRTCKTQEPQCWSTTQTTKLLRTLRESEELLNLVHSLRFRCLYYRQTPSLEDAKSRGVGGLVKSWMTLATKLSSVEVIDGSFRTITRQVLASPNCPTTIMLTLCDLDSMCSPFQARQAFDINPDPDQQSQWSDEQARIDTNLGRLTHLKCGDLSVADPGRGERRTSLSSLEELEISGKGTSESPYFLEFHLEPTDFPHLHSLRIPLFYTNFFTSPGILPNLKRLSLATPSNCEDSRDYKSCDPKLDRLSNLPSLEFVSFGIYSLRASINSGLSHFLRNLPPHLTQLEFPSRAPFDVLLDAATSVGRLEIGFPEPLDYEQGKKLRIERLREALQANGGSVYFIGKR